MPAQPPARQSEPPAGRGRRESLLRLAQCDQWLLAILELVSMRTSFFFVKMLNNSGFIPMWSGKNFEILNIFEGLKTISHPVIATSLIRMCLKPLQQELSRAGLSWIPLPTRNAVVRGHVSSEKKYLQ